MKVLISSIRHGGEGIRVFELRAVDGAPLPSYEAGAHIDLTLGNGMVRQYSLCCDTPSPQRYRIAVKQEPMSRGGSSWLHAQAAVGTVLDISAPRNAFALAPKARMHLLFAGGIGITPILSMAYALLRRGEPFHLFYFVRDAAAVAFGDELAALPLSAKTSIFTGLDAGQSADAIRDALDLGTAGAEIYTCGPAPFMSAVTQQAAARFGEHAVHQEFFVASTPAGGDLPFVIRLLKQGKDIQVPADRNALSCLQDAGIDVDCSCEVGVCGTCRTAIVDGVPDHRDSYLSASEKSANLFFMPCVSRAKTPGLTIDL